MAFIPLSLKVFFLLLLDGELLSISEKETGKRYAGSDCVIVRKATASCVLRHIHVQTTRLRDDRHPR